MGRILHGPKDLLHMRCVQGICGDKAKGSPAVALYPQVDGPHPKAWHYVPVCKFHAEPDWFADGPQGLPTFEIATLHALGGH